MKTHSPAPWIVRKMELYEEGSSKQNGIEVTDAEGNAVCCNQTYYPTSLKPENAHIIAAAPELLEAVEAFINYDANALYTDDHVKLMLDYAEMLSKAKAAIKKAKGE